MTVRVGRALLLEDAQHVVVGVAVVDLQRLAGALGQVDVPAERILLHPNALGPGAVVVEPGLADHPHPRVRGQLLDLRVGRVEAPGLGQPGRLVGVQGHPAEHRGVRSTISTVNRAPGQVAADLDQPVHPDRPGRGDGGGHVGGRPRRRGRCRGGCGCRRPRSAAGRGRRAPARDRALTRRRHRRRRGARRRAVSVSLEPGELLLDDRLVELGEDRCGLHHRGPDATGTRLPARASRCTRR